MELVVAYNCTYIKSMKIINRYVVCLKGNLKVHVIDDSIFLAIYFFESDMREFV